MFTNFDNYSSGDVKITAIFCLPNGNKSTVQVYNDVLVEDLIDKCFWKHKIIDYKEDELILFFNGKKLDKNLTLSEYNAEYNVFNTQLIIQVVDCRRVV